MKNVLRMMLAVALICAALLSMSSSYAQAYEGEQKNDSVKQETVDSVGNDTQFLRIEVIRKEDDLIKKADTGKNGTTTGQVYINVSMAEYNATDLSDYTTEKLVVFILNNHKSMASMIYDHVPDPYTSAKRYYHGLEELETHEDALDVLNRALKVLEAAEPTTDTERIIYDMRAEFIRMVLKSDFYVKKTAEKNGVAKAHSVEGAQPGETSRSLIGSYGFLYDYAGTVYSKG